MSTIPCRAARRCLGWLCLFSSLAIPIALLSLSGQAAEEQAGKPPALEEQLLRQAPMIREYIWKKMKHPQHSLNVGVVNFLVQIDDQKPNANAGPLNDHLARRLEAALILTLPDDADNQDDTIRILHLHDPSKELMRSANHQTPEGRKVFFQKKYMPAWGSKKKIPADVFLTGVVKLTDEARTLQVVVQAFDATDRKLVEVCSFKAAAEPRLLTEAGVSFALSRGVDPKEIAEAVASSKPTELPPQAATVVQNKGKQGFKPKQSVTIRELLEQSPVEFEVYYKKGKDEARKQPIDEDGMLAEPLADTRVTFRLKHKNPKDKHVYGVVLKVNGENTIYPEDAEPDDFLAHKWVLAPGDAFTIPGRLSKNLKGKAATFTALPRPESRLEEVNYGSHAGTFTIVIFLGRTDGQPPAENTTSEVASARGAIRRGVPDELGNPNSLRALQGKLRRAGAANPDPMKWRPRGLIVPGETVKQAVDNVEFTPYPKPVSVIHLRYYKPYSEE